MHKKHDIPAIATSDVHYIYKEDWDDHDTFLCISTGRLKDESLDKEIYIKTHKKDPEGKGFRPRMKYTNDFWLRSKEEMVQAFMEQEDGSSSFYKDNAENPFQTEDYRNFWVSAMENTAKILRSVMKSLIVDGIKYQRIGDSEYYCQELFESKELKGYLESNMLESHKGIYNYVVYDSENERKFAAAFEDNDDVLLYAKLPDWFKISTPLGAYNPDWAVMINQNGEKKLYFVLETKGNIDADALRQTESEKIQCGMEHFVALGDAATFMPVDDFSEFMHSI